jgi:PAS domain S-box-containing protein
MIETDAGRHVANTTTSISNVTTNHLVDFTKRRDWQQRTIEAIQDLLYVLAFNGKILYASASCVSVTGYQPTQIAGHFIHDFIHPDDKDVFVKEMGDAIATGDPLRFFHRFRKADGGWIIFESHGHAHLSKGFSRNSLQRGSIDDGGLFITARPDPTKNAALMDSFLEHKIENLRLMDRLRELRDEGEDNSERQDWQEETAEG